MVDCGGLENRCTFTGTVGSNPTASANYFKHLAVEFWQETRSDFKRKYVGSNPTASANYFKHLAIEFWQETGSLFKRKYWLVLVLVGFCTLKPGLPWNHLKPGHCQA